MKINEIENRDQKVKSWFFENKIFKLLGSLRDERERKKNKNTIIRNEIGNIPIDPKTLKYKGIL